MLGSLIVVLRNPEDTNEAMPSRDQVSRTYRSPSQGAYMTSYVDCYITFVVIRT